MEVTQDIGPAAQQLNIPAVGAYVNDISITATKAGHTLILAKLDLFNLAINEQIAIFLHRNGAFIPGSRAYRTTHAAEILDSLTAICAITDAAIGDIFKIFVTSSTGTADIDVNAGTLIIVTA